MLQFLKAAVWDCRISHLRLNSSVPKMSSLLMICFPSFILFPSNTICIFSSLFLELSWVMCSNRIRWHGAFLCLVLLCCRKNLLKVRNLRKGGMTSGKNRRNLSLENKQWICIYSLVNNAKEHMENKCIKCFHNLSMMRYEQFKVGRLFLAKSLMGQSLRQILIASVTWQ